MKQSGNRLLVVDDEKAVTEFISEVAEGIGFSVDLVHDGRHFQRSYIKQRPSVIILDLNLPGIDGIEILRLLSEQKCTAKILITSGSDSRTIAAVRQIGMQQNLSIAGVLPKPLLVEDVEAALTPLLATQTSVLPIDVESAIENGEIQLHYQPKIDLVNGTGVSIAGVEALVRWIKPDGSMIYPDEFLPIVATEGLMPLLTETVVECALDDASVWIQAGLDLVTSVNLDGSLFDDLSLPDRMASMAGSRNVPTSKMTFEVTETAAMANTTATMDILTRLRVKNFNVSMDDFGTGYSSLIQLYRLPFNELKIDKSFVMDIGKNNSAIVIVEALTILGKKLGLKVCAEGIENRNALEQVRKYGCDLGQGYLFSKPVSASRIRELSKDMGKVWKDLEIAGVS